MRLVRLLLGFALAMMGVASTASASDPFPDSIPLPDDFAPEGIAVGAGSSFFVGSLAGGDIYRGDLRSGTGPCSSMRRQVGLPSASRWINRATC